MLIALSVLCALIWLLLLIHQISHRGLLVLVVWLAIAPVASNIAAGHTNPFFQPPQSPERYQEIPTKRGVLRQSITLRELTNKPTRLFITLYMVVFLFDALSRRRRLFPLDSTEIYMGIFTVILLVNVFFRAEHFAFNLRIAYDTFLVSFFSYFITRRLVQNPGEFQRIIQILGFLGGYLILIGIAERLMHPNLFYRLRGPFDLGTAFYYTLMVVFFAVLSVSIRGKDELEVKPKLPPIVRWSIIGFVPLIIGLIWSRGVWVGFFLGLWIFMLLGYRVLNLSRKLIVIGTALLLLPVVALSIKPLIPEEVIEQRVGNQQTVEWRFKRWDVAIEEATRAPIFGIGLSNLRSIFYKRFGDDSAAHNSFLTIFAEMGIVGLLGVFAIFFSIIRLALRLCRQGRHSRDHLRGAAILAMLAAYLIPGFFAETIFGAVEFSTVYMFVFIGGVAGLYSQPRLMLGSAQTSHVFLQQKSQIHTTLQRY